MGEGLMHFYEFGPFRVDATERTLLRDGEPVPLRPKDFDMLLALVEHSGRVLGKDELLRRVWPGQFVEEANLSHHVFTLRRVLGEDKGGGKYIETVPRRGYRFVAGVSEVSAEGANSAAAEHTRPHHAGGGEEVAGPSTLDAGAGLAAEGKAPPVSPLVRGRFERQTFLALAAGVLAVGLGVAAYFWPAGRAEQTGTEAAVRSIAVLPFKPLAAGGRDETLELGMADTLITKLGAVRAVTVRPVSAVRRYTSLEQDAAAAGRELSVEAVLDGSIQRSGDRVRVTARLVRVTDGGQLWAGKFDEEFTDIFSVQDAISEQVARSLALRLSGEEERRLARRDTENAEAYELYLKGRYFWNKRTEEGLRRGIEHFRQAIASDPGYALAYSGLADSYAVLKMFGDVAPRDAFPHAKEAAERALSLDDTLAEAHTSLASVREAFEWDFTGAESGYRRAIDLNPDYATARHRYGVFLSLMGRFDEGLAELERARRLDPLSLIVSADIGFANYLARRYDRCIDQLRKTVEMEPNFVRPHVYLVDCYVQKGMVSEAVAEARKASELSGRAGAAKSLLSYGYAAAGREGEARKLLEELTARGEGRFTQPLALAATYMVLGDHDRAIEQLERGYEQRAYAMLRLHADPRVDGLRSDPRFQNLVGRIGHTP